MSETAERKCICAVKIRGTISALREARNTLKMLHLTRTNYAILINNHPSLLGMLKAARDYITWGEPSKETVHALIMRRGRLAGNKKLTDEYARNAHFKSLEDLIEAVFSCRVEYRKLPNIQPVFKLHPPSKGFKGKIKKSYESGGELGYRSEKIDALIKRMI